MELISKGILLSSSIEFGKVLNDSGREDLLAIYEKLKENHKRIDQLQSSSSQQDLELLLSLRQENIPLTNQLMNGCKEVRDFTDYLSYTWKDVQKSLSDGDVAIEFVTLKASYSDRDTFLAALVLQATGMPQMVIVSSKAILNALAAKDDLYDNPSYYKNIWGRLQPFIEGNGRIFFAPNNLLASIAIENIIDKDAPIFETRKVYRLSSTKELCKGRLRVSPESISIFGDIDYNSETASQTKGGMAFGSLAYGAEEVDGIVNQIEGKFRPMIYRGSLATEKQFYELSNDCPDILHVSSHGKYAGTESTRVEDAMQYSLLALSGANRISMDGANDGIVSASDVAEMNLRNCDLVVLSACETGLGGLGADGVFGLQRGFKNAGVNTILMSLKPVYDESTAKLMIAFYAALADGMTKREALVHAQRTLRENPSYRKGKYWAPFILLDALPE
ncbi:MAG: CHAT domain-containing protein [Candidatus Cryptobacteroides sp.]